jgi:hypothetical protein
MSRDTGEARRRDDKREQAERIRKSHDVSSRSKLRLARKPAALHGAKVKPGLTASTSAIGWRTRMQARVKSGVADFDGF